MCACVCVCRIAFTIPILLQEHFALIEACLSLRHVCGVFDSFAASMGVQKLFLERVGEFAYLKTCRQNVTISTRDLLNTLESGSAELFLISRFSGLEKDEQLRIAADLLIQHAVGRHPGLAAYYNAPTEFEALPGVLFRVVASARLLRSHELWKRDLSLDGKIVVTGDRFAQCLVKHVRVLVQQTPPAQSFGLWLLMAIFSRWPPFVEGLTEIFLKVKCDLGKFLAALLTAVDGQACLVRHPFIVGLKPKEKSLTYDLSTYTLTSAVLPWCRISPVSYQNRRYIISGDVVCSAVGPRLANHTVGAGGYLHLLAECVDSHIEVRQTSQHMVLQTMHSSIFQSIFRDITWKNLSACVRWRLKELRRGSQSHMFNEVEMAVDEFWAQSTSCKVTQNLVAQLDPEMWSKSQYAEAPHCDFLRRALADLGFQVRLDWQAGQPRRFRWRPNHDQVRLDWQAGQPHRFRWRPNHEFGPRPMPGAKCKAKVVHKITKARGPAAGASLPCYARHVPTPQRSCGEAG